MAKKKKKTWKSDLKKEMTIRKLMLESQKHDHETCNCDGCFWWQMTRTIAQKARLFFVVGGWKDLDRDEYLRMMQRTIQYRIDKKVSIKKLTKYIMTQGKMSKEQAKSTAQNMIAPIIKHPTNPKKTAKQHALIFMVMVGNAPSPMGLLRDI